MSGAARPSFLQVFVAHRNRILRDAAVISLVLIAASFLIPNQYTAHTVLLPPSPDQDLSGLLTGVTGNAVLSRAFGLDAGSGTNLYMGVLRSETVRDSLVRQFGLIRAYKVKNGEKARKKLGENTALTVTGDEFVEVAVTDRDRTRAANLANAYVEQLDHFLRTNTNTSAGRRRQFLEKRLTDTRRDLVVAEDALRDYQVRKGVPAVGSDVDRSARGAADLVAEKMSREVELGALENVAVGANPRVEQLRNEIGEIDLQIAKIPPATTELARLFREVKIQERILLLLTEEYERARVLELKDIPTVQIVDVAHPPIQKSFPRRTLIGGAVVIITLSTLTALAWMRERALQAG